MIINRDILFIQLGKTDVMLVTDYLCNNLKTPVYHVLPRNQLENSKPLGYEQRIPGNLHESLAIVQEIIAHYKN